MTEKFGAETAAGIEDGGWGILVGDMHHNRYLEWTAKTISEVAS
jgi:hypothetical protein